ncbi:hypothetical protein CCMSSC00406_0007560 [Pleurotus cornucopiae]|uniref:Uncharacterized protein n=1 Tax=Pleurotus cornucopiae TaxID=5321 RepID=A0ACB7J8K2_PLECO|nr:hypothetical protein CCMSSC00406_0007560 [Pleurotus cornucopiae]
MSNSIPLTARAAVLVDFEKDVVIATDHPVRQTSELAPGECLIKIEYAGVCHSDLHIRQGGWGRKLSLPLIGGHEGKHPFVTYASFHNLSRYQGVGHVVAIGEHTVDSQVKIGDRVGIKWIANVCMKCEMCRKGAESSCPLSFQRASGYSMDGTFADYVVSYANYVTPIPPSVGSAEAVSILCAGVTVYKALKQTRTIVGHWVAISGAGGGLGHLAVQYAVAMGLRVLAIDTGEEKKKLVQSLGAEAWVDFMESKDLIQDIKDATDGLGPHAAVIAAGSSTPFNQAILYLRPLGTLVAVGMPKDAAMNIPIALFIGKSLTVVGTSVGNRQDAIEALDLVARGKVKCHYQEKQLQDLNQIYTEMEAGRIVGRIVLKM